jgi:DNA-binding NtrC family response regulator
LAAFFRTLVAKLNLELGKRISTEPRGDVLAKLATYSWPGNVRELEKVLRTAMMSARANMLTPSTIRLPEGPKSALVDSSSDPLDLAERILAGKAGWDEFKEIQGGARRVILVKLWATLARKDGREPGSKDLAALFGTTDDNVRQMLKKQGGISSLKTADTSQDSSHL